MHRVAITTLRRGAAGRRQVFHHHVGHHHPPTVTTRRIHSSLRHNVASSSRNTSSTNSTRRSFSQQSSSTGAAPPPPIQPPPVSHLRQLRLIIQWTIILSVIDITLTDGETFRPMFYIIIDKFGMPLLRLLDPEQAHDIAIWAASNGLLPRNDHGVEDASLRVNLWGREFPNPVGLAAGFDKHAQAMEGLLGLGLGFVEIGSVTPEPQDGNPKPRMFRLSEDRGVINRYGFNSHGIEEVKKRLEEFWHKRSYSYRGMLARGLIGVNLGKNKLTEKAEEDYIKGVTNLCSLADYVVINVSSPNTPGLRTLQKRSQMEALIKAVKRKMCPMNLNGKPVPLLIKIAPDLTDDEKKDIAEVAKRTGIDGLIISNTTISRPETLKSEHKGETGGLSGTPVKDLSTATIRDLYTLTKGKIPIIGVGGIATGEDAYEKIRAGASLVEVYSMLVYEGPGSIRRIKKDLAECLKRDGFASVKDAVGVPFAPGTSAAGGVKHVVAYDTKK